MGEEAPRLYKTADSMFPTRSTTADEYFRAERGVSAREKVSWQDRTLVAGYVSEGITPYVHPRLTLDQIAAQVGEDRERLAVILGLRSGQIDADAYDNAAAFALEDAGEEDDD